MNQNKILSGLCTVLFLVGIIVSFLDFVNPGSRVPKYILFSVSAGYLFSGWYIFRGYHPDGHPLLLFLFGYLYSSIFAAFAFASAGWPLGFTFVGIAIAWAVIQIIMSSVLRKKLPAGGFGKFLMEGLMMLVMAVLWITKL
jgi:hypothetical protein